MKSVVIIILMLFSLQLKAQFSDFLVFVGPKFNFNFGNGQHRFSGGLEASVWTYNNNSIPFGADFGFEVERDNVRIYADIQAGMLLGLSMGPVIEIANKRANLGFQTALWGAAFIGAEVKYRRIDSKNYFAPGFMIKLPLHTSQYHSDGTSNEYDEFSKFGIIN